jgi:hypothetical protein
MINTYARRLFSPEPLVVKQPKFTRVEEPALLCNQVKIAREPRRLDVRAGQAER